MANMARDMFGVQRTASSEKSGGRAGAAAAPQRPAGVPRELFMLTGGVTPASLMPAAPTGLQEKPTARRRWQRVAFQRTSDPARRALELKHWAPVGQPHDAYAFERFNKPVRMMTYSDAEWDAVVADLHPLNVDEEALAAFKRDAAAAVPAGDASAAPTPEVTTQPKTLRTTKAGLFATKISGRIERGQLEKRLAEEAKNAAPSPSPAASGALAPAAAIALAQPVAAKPVAPASSPTATIAVAPATPATPAAPAAAAAAAASAAAAATPAPPAGAAAGAAAGATTPAPPAAPAALSTPKAAQPSQPQTKTPAPTAADQPPKATAASGDSAAASTTTKSPKAASPSAPQKTLKDIMSPIVKAPSAAPPTSVAAGTRKSIMASPKALALAAEAANIQLPDPSAKPPRPPKSPRVGTRTRTRRGEAEGATESAAAPATPAAPAAAEGAEAAPQAPTPESLHYVKPQKPWSRAETDELFALCRRFDLRFAVIHDRWPGGFAARSVEELKDRYYSVAKALIEHRQRANKDGLAGLPLALQKHCQAITMNPYDYEYECIRKNQQEYQYRRSKAELREEEETVREARRIESARKRQAKERQRIAKLLAGPGRGAEAAAAANAALAAGSAMKFSHRKQLTGAYPRSSLIYTPVSSSQRSSKRIDAALNELGVGTRPTPTTIVVDNFDLLRCEILQFIELQRTVAKKEEDVYSLRVKLAKLNGVEPPPPPPGVNLSHKKRKMDEFDFGSLFGPPTKKLRTG